MIFSYFDFYDIWTTNELLALVFTLYLLGLVGIFANWRNFLVAMMCTELMYLSIIISFVIHSSSTCDAKGQIYALILLIIAASESAVGLGMLIVLYRFGDSVAFSRYCELKG